MGILIAAPMLAACDSGRTDGGASSGTGSIDSGKPKEIVTLKWWHWGDAPKNGDHIIDALNAKSARDIGVKIDFIWAAGEDARLKSALSTGVDDDIAFSCSWFANYADAAQKEQLYDITEMQKQVESS